MLRIPDPRVTIQSESLSGLAHSHTHTLTRIVDTPPPCLLHDSTLLNIAHKAPHEFPNLPLQGTDRSSRPLLVLLIFSLFGSSSAPALRIWFNCLSPRRLVAVPRRHVSRVLSVVRLPSWILVSRTPAWA